MTAATPRLLLTLGENWTMTPARDLRALVAQAVAAEEAGFDGVVVSEHVVLGPGAGAGGRPANPRDWAGPGNQDPDFPWPSSIVMLSAVAAATSRLRLVAGAVIAPLRHPLLLAKDLATLDLLSEGRLVVLPTVSWQREEYEALGVPFEHRGEILDEQLEIWAEVWNGSPTSYAGRHFRFADVHVEPQPYRRGGPVLWFGGGSVNRRLVARLARYGAGFMPMGRVSSEDRQRIADAMAGAGRAMSDLEVVGGIGGRFPDATSVADLDQALASVPRQVAAGIRTIVVKPSQFTDDGAHLGTFCREVVEKVAALTA